MNANLFQAVDAPLRHFRGIKVVAVINGIGFGLTLIFWLLGLVSGVLPNPSRLATIAERGNAATTFGFMIADFIWAVPLLFLGTIGVWRRSPWGWMAANMVNILWCYSLTVILIRDSYTRISPGGILFLPFVPFAIWSTIYLWKRRGVFFSQNNDFAPSNRSEKPGPE
jgi:hypothetical protein